MKINVKGSIISNADAWIYEWFGEPYTSPDSVHSALEEAAGEDVDIDINSPGGDIFAGSEIYAAIRDYKGNVNIHIVGLAASAASVIACAAHSDMAPTAQIMVHNVSSYASGDYHEMDKTSEILQKANKAIAAAYVHKTGMSEKDALDLMECETWLTAQEAVNYGLVDGISESRNTNAAQPVNDIRMAAAVSGMLPASVIDKMQARRNELIEFFS